MKDVLNENTLTFLRNRMLYLLSYFLPGILIFELIFSKGFFSKIPSTLYEFILYVFWIMIFSLPFNIYSPISYLKSINKILMKNKIQLTSEMKIELEKIDGEFKFYYVLFLLIITLLSNNYFTLLLVKIFDFSFTPILSLFILYITAIILIIIIRLTRIPKFINETITKKIDEQVKQN